jgi:phosphoglycolate phosphatase
MKKEYILFDLDGTLTDPKLGITKSVAYALNKFGIEVENLDTLEKFIGPPLMQSFQEYYGFSQEKARLAVEKYREYFGDKGLFENYVYDGIEKMLANLNANGKTLILATSKPTYFAAIILEHFRLYEYFKFVAGSELDETRVEKAEVISYALEQCNIPDLEKVIMVGDRKHDMIGADLVGIDSVGVLYGYGGRNELESAKANYIVSNVTELEHLLLDL